MKNRPLLKKRQAQQLVEFAFAAPILLIFIFIIVEMGAAMNNRITLAEAVKAGMMEVNKLSSLKGNTANKENKAANIIRDKVRQYLINHNITNSRSVSVSVNYNDTDNTAFVFVSYDYVPHFLISGLTGNNVSSITFSSSQTINPNIFKPNVFPGGSRNTRQLSGYHTTNGYVFIESGALIDTTPFDYGDGVLNLREHIAFLVRFYQSPGTHPFLQYNVAHARLTDWLGNDLLPPNLRINLRTGTLEVRSPYYQGNNDWFNTQIPYIWVVTSLGFTHVIYVKYNSTEMHIPDDASLLYKLRFNDTDAFYNRGIRFCGTDVDSGPCDGDQRNTETVNERALRMNPRLGEKGSWNNNYIIGTMEPIIKTPVNHDFMHVKGLYFSYTDDYLNWNPATWSQQYFVSIASPRIIALGQVLYTPTIANPANNPFYRPYRYRFKLFEHDRGANAGMYDSTAAAPPGQDGDGDDGDGNIYYQVDIVDVYIDSDGDGIPDAWDRDPEYFDANVNGILDGNEVSDFWSQTICRDGAVTPSPPCDLFPDAISTNTTEALPGVVHPDKVVRFDASPGMPYYISTPYGIGGAIEPARTTRNLPAFKPAQFEMYLEAGGGRALYYDIDGTNYTRRVPTWWDSAIAPDFPARRNEKVNFIHGTVAGNTINLNPSAELIFASSTSRIIRTPAGW